MIADISYWQSTADFQKMKSAGLQGVVLRGGQGFWQDKKFDIFRADADGVLPFGSYWYYDNNFSPKRQAELYAEIIRDNAGTLGAWLDIEDSDAGSFGQWQHWYDFSEYFKQTLPTVRLGIYTRAEYFNSRVPRTNKYFSQYPLWIAQYKTVEPDMPHNWTDWLMWQFTAEGDGVKYGVGSREIDLNYTKELPTQNVRHVTLNFQDTKVLYKENK